MRGSLGVALSAALHAGAFLALGWVRFTPDERAVLAPVDIAIIDAPEPAPAAVPEPEPLVEPEPEPEPAVKPAPKPVVRAPKPATEPAPKPKEPPPTQAAPPPPAEETIADFSGTTLTGEGASGWVSAVGSGGAMTGPIGKPNAAVTGRNRTGVQGGVVGGEEDGTGTAVVPFSSLSRPPRAPSADELNAALERHYPKQAKQQGIEGSAKIRVRVLATGKLQPLATVSESYPGFGEACKSSLRGMSWEPGLDRGGKPVATDLPYTCEFMVE